MRAGEFTASGAPENCLIATDLPGEATAFRAIKVEIEMKAVMLNPVRRAAAGNAAARS